MCICNNCNEKLKEHGVLGNEDMCEKCRKIIEDIVNNEVKLLVTT